MGACGRRERIRKAKWWPGLLKREVKRGFRVNQLGMIESGMTKLGTSKSGMTASGMSKSGMNESGMSKSGMTESGMSKSGMTKVCGCMWVCV